MRRHYVVALVLALVVAGFCTFSVHVDAAQQQPAPVQPASCPVAEDDQYAYTKERPVQVGGSPVYGAARQRRYLDALRGPAGQPVQYKRAGTVQGPGGTLLDSYEVTYQGLEKPVIIFLDWYHYNPQRAPRGFTCGQPFDLGPPPVSPFQEMDDVRGVALAQGASREFAPIPLDADGTTTHGVIYDRFRMLARAARAASAAGSPLDPKNPPRELAQQGMVVVAYPLTCEGRPVQVTAIDLVASNGAVAPRTDQPQTASVGKLLPGVQIPEGSLVATFPVANPRQGDSIRITHAEGCGPTSDVVTLPMKFTAARAVETPMPSLPAGAPTAQPVLLQALLDLDGTLQGASYVGGPAELTAAAIEAVGRWKSEPPRINGAPMPLGVMLQVRFTAVK